MSGDGAVVIAGGGLAAQRCAETLRRLGHAGPVAMVCAEAHLPYDRPPLSKEVLIAAQAEERVCFRTPEWYAERAIEPILGVAARGIDAAARRLLLADGRALPYEHLVIATGARPRMLPAFAAAENVSTLRTLDDARALRTVLAGAPRLLIVGAGFIGLEVAAAARAHGAAVTVVEAEPLPLHGLLGREVGEWLAALHTDEGVALCLGQTVAQVHGGGHVEEVTLQDGRRIASDHVLVAVGVTPELGWTAGSGLPAGGIPVDAGGRSALAGVYAAGDVAAFFDPLLGRHALVGHWEAAGRQGAAVAHAIAGAELPAPALSSFWSDQYGVRLNYLGHASLADAVGIEDGPGPRELTALYTRAGELVAAFAAGRPRALGELRERISALMAASG